MLRERACVFVWGGGGGEGYPQEPYRRAHEGPFLRVVPSFLCWTSRDNAPGSGNAAQYILTGLRVMAYLDGTLCRRDRLGGHFLCVEKSMAFHAITNRLSSRFGMGVPIMNSTRKFVIFVSTAVFQDVVGFLDLMVAIGTRSTLYKF